MNRFIIGQLAFGFGAAALMVTVFAPNVIEYSRGRSAWPNSMEEMPDEVASVERACCVVSVLMAMVGIALAAIGYFRERPPLLPIVGGVLCVLVLGWHPIGWAVGLLSVALVLVFMLTPLGDLIVALCWLVARAGSGRNRPAADPQTPSASQREGEG